MLRFDKLDEEYDDSEMVGSYSGKNIIRRKKMRENINDKDFSRKNNYKFNRQNKEKNKNKFLDSKCK